MKYFWLAFEGGNDPIIKSRNQAAMDDFLVMHATDTAKDEEGNIILNLKYKKLSL